ncbi:MAG: TonB family protein [Nitrospirae bacterium]|nr:TonB family protein [Nitrospirota bacterium]
MRQPSVQISTIASFLLHTVVFAVFMYTVKHQPRFVLPKPYTVKLVSTIKAPTVEPSLGEPHAIHKPAEKELPPVKEEASKPPKYEMKENPKPAPQPQPQPQVEAHKPVPAKPLPVKPLEDKGPKVVKEPPKPVDAKPEIAKKSSPQPAQPMPQPIKEAPKDTAKDATSVEDRISMLKSKKKLQQHAMLHSVVDVGKKDVKMGQSPTGATQSTSPSFGDAVNNEYSDIVGAHVRKRWAYPESAKKSLEAIVVFTIKQDGRIEGMKLEKSSGNSFFDRSALSAVNKSVPMPQPPLDAYEVGIRFTQ